MKKIGITILTAFIGGAVAIGGYKLIENKYADSLSIEERQKVHFANNPVSVSSAGDVDFIQAAAAVSPAVIHIKTTYDASSRSGGGSGDPMEEMFRDFFGTPRGGGGGQRQPQMASGSGVIVTPDGYIITNNHVVENASKIDIILPDNRSYVAKVVGTDPNTDLALVKVDAKNLPVVKLGNSDNVQVGEWVLAVGYPFTLQSTVTAGIVSAKGRSIGILGESGPRRNRGQVEEPTVNAAIESFIQTDAAINRGNSGGALVNTQGELIGINAAIASQSGSYEGYGFAIPINLAKKIMDDFIKFGEVKRGFVGVTFNQLDASRAKELGVSQISGLYVNEVVEGGGAQAAGLKKGDIITKVDGIKVQNSSDLQEKVGRLRPGDKVQLGYVRDGSERTASVTLKGESSVKIASNNSVEANAIMSALGGNFATMTAAQKQRFKLNSGVIVAGARPGGLLYENSITKGTIITQINGKAVNKIEDIEAAVVASKNNMMRIDGITTDGARFMVTFPVLQ